MRFILIILLGFAVSCAGRKNYTSQVKAPQKSVNNALNFFKSPQSFDIEDAKAGETGISVRNGLLTFDIKDWPPQFKDFLAKEFSKLDFYETVVKYLDGIYLGSFKANSEKVDSSHLNGMTLNLSSNGKMIVILNSDLVLSPRKHIGNLDKTYDDVQTQFLKIDGYDLAIVTLVHELFHVLDFGMYILDNADGAFSDRDKLLSLSWRADNGNIVSKFKLPQPVNIEIKDEHSVSMFLKETIRYDRELRLNTNFIHEKATTNFIEDFAVSLTTYYLHTRYHTPTEEFTIYSDAQNNNAIYRSSDVDIMKIEKNRLKVCSHAELILKEKCRI